MAVVVSPNIQDLINQGNGLLSEYNQQGLALHQLVFQQKEVGSKIDTIITKFGAHGVMSKPRDTIAVLQEVMSSYQAIKSNINTLEAKEKEISSLVQNMLARHHHGHAEYGRVHAEIVSTHNTIVAIHKEIEVAHNNLNNMAAELEHLKKNIRDAERRVARKRKQRFWWIAASIITFGLATVGVVGAFKSVKAAKVALAQRRQIYSEAENNFKNLQTSIQQQQEHRERLEQDQRQRQFDIRQIEEILHRLQPALHDTSKYRQYLLKLSDAFNQVNIYVERLEQNLRTVQEIHTAGHSPDGSMGVTIFINYKNLSDAWDTAKIQPAFQTVLSLQDSNNPEATLKTIKLLHLQRRKKKSVEYHGKIGRCLG